MCCDFTKFCQSEQQADIDKDTNFKIVAEKDFLNKCQTGDFMLFRNNMIQGKFLRTITWSQFDHVAMIIKFQ